MKKFITILLICCLFTACDFSRINPNYRSDDDVSFPENAINCHKVKPYWYEFDLNDRHYMMKFKSNGAYGNECTIFEVYK